VNRVIRVALLILLCCVFEAFSWQQRPVPPPLTAPQPEQNSPSVPPEMQRDMQKKANKQRQQELRRDADRLMKLSTELKEYVEKSNENVLSIDVIRKAEEIERLAHSVKTKMRDGT
jgi:hypothetical protein